MPYSIFVSDLHLTRDRPRACEQFFEFVTGPASRATAIYILGDLFEYWIGDDDLDDPFNAAIARALAGLSGRGIALHFMQGNRDVLAGPVFATRSGAQPIPDPTLIDVLGTRTLLMHGDTLCTGDADYQQFRAYAHDPESQRTFLGLPLEARRRQMLEWRMQSEHSKQGKNAEIMDVAPAAVEQALREHGYPRLIHGHTHRPARHVHTVDGRPCERWVLTDWYGRAGYLRCGPEGCEAVVL